ncbi:MAG TPA: hypothetical protein VFO34_01540 [Candidatus Acidoferrales bacterium]|nr:hypothetical protein [Candidatus Acidoferrales bacterium]
MRSALLVAGFVSLLSSGVLSQDSSTLKANQGAAVTAIEKAAVAALNFRQGDATGLNHSRADFTADGWNDFVKTMKAFLDDKGAPTFTSTFVAAREARILDEKDGVVHFRIPGTSMQSSQLGKTTYQYPRFAVEVYAIRETGERKFRIQQLKQVTCAAETAACN